MSQTRLDVRDRTAWITIDDGKANVMSHDLLDEVTTRLDDAAEDARVIVLSGRSGIFSAGFDLKAFRRGPDALREMMDAGVRLIVKMLECPVPIVAACTGHAYPMGAFLLLCADVRIGIEGDWRIGLNEVAIGITLPPFALALARHRLAPAACARVTTATMFSPNDAVAAGYLDETVSATKLFDRCHEVATEMIKLDSAAYIATKARVVGTLLESIRSQPY